MLPRNKYLSAWVASLYRHESTLAAEISKVRNRMVRTAAGSYENDSAIPNYLLAIYKSDIANALSRSYRATAFTFGNLVMGQVRSVKSHKNDFLSTIFERLVADWIKRNALQKAEWIASTDIERIRNVIHDGVAAGDGNEQIGLNIRNEIKITPMRAATIARTEVHAAAVYAAMQTARDSQDTFNIKFTKEWGAVHDSRTRPEHIAADGQKVAMDEKFHVGSDFMDAPGDPEASADMTINCRCAVYHEEVLPDDF